MRLVGGYERNEGRVEVCINQAWGTVCDNSWNSNDANVVCGQLGYLQRGIIELLYYVSVIDGIIPSKCACMTLCRVVDKIHFWYYIIN